MSKFLTPAEFVAALQGLQTLQQEQKYPQLAKALWELLMKLFSAPYVTPAEQDKKLLSMCGAMVMKIFADPKFQVPDSMAFDYLNFTVLISNLIYQSEFKNTDMVLKLLLEQQAPMSKLLPLYSFRNTLPFDIEAAFNRNPKLVYAWMTNVIMHGRPGCIDEAASEWCKRLLQLPALQGRSDYIGDWRYYQLLLSTYTDPAQDRAVKTAINKALAASQQKTQMPAGIDKNKILVVSSMMYPAHAVYKSMYPLIASLEGHYELVYIKPLAPDDMKMPWTHESWRLDKVLARILKEKAGMILYPEIALDQMTAELSNMRLAPIQLTMYGHPVSSYAAEIDYYIASKDAEVIEKIEENYSERAVLIPGLAAISVYPTYELRHPERLAALKDAVIISCAWGALKINRQMIDILKKILARSKTRIIFRFTDIWVQYLSFVPIQSELQAALGKEHVHCFPELSYENYMYVIEDTDFALDSYPFCGFNRTVDTLVCGKPMVVLEGTKIYNRIGGYIMRKIGMGELVADDEETFIATVLRMAEDKEYRARMTAKVKALDLRHSVCNTESAPYFKKAVDTLIARDRELRAQTSRAPIVIT